MRNTCYAERHSADLMCSSFQVSRNVSKCTSTVRFRNKLTFSCLPCLWPPFFSTLCLHHVGQFLPHQAMDTWGAPVHGKTQCSTNNPKHLLLQAVQWACLWDSAGSCVRRVHRCCGLQWRLPLHICHAYVSNLIMQ